MQQLFEASTDQRELIEALVNRRSAQLKKLFDDVMEKDISRCAEELDRVPEDNQKEDAFVNCLMFKSNLDEWFTKHIDGIFSHLTLKDKDLPAELEKYNTKFMEEIRKLSVEKMKTKKQFSVDPLYVESNTTQILRRITEEQIHTWEDLIRSAVNNAASEIKLSSNQVAVKLTQVDSSDASATSIRDDSVLVSLTPIKPRVSSGRNHLFMDSQQNLYVSETQSGKIDPKMKNHLFNLQVNLLRAIDGLEDSALALTTSRSLVLLSNITSKNDFTKIPLFGRVHAYGSFYSTEESDGRRKLVVLALISSGQDPAQPSPYTLSVRVIEVKNKRVISNKLGFCLNGNALQEFQLASPNKKSKIELFEIESQLVFSYCGGLVQEEAATKLQVLLGKITTDTITVAASVKPLAVDWRDNRKVNQISGQHIEFVRRLTESRQTEPLRNPVMHVLLNVATTPNSTEVTNCYDYRSYKFVLKAAEGNAQATNLDLEDGQVVKNLDLNEKKRQRSGPVIAFAAVSDAHSSSLYYITTGLHYFAHISDSRQEHVSSDQKNLSEYYKAVDSVVHRDASADLLIMDRTCGEGVHQLSISLLANKS